MKKTLLCLVAFFLSVTLVSAQGVRAEGTPSVALVKKGMTLGISPKDMGKTPSKLNAPVSRISLDPDERLFGYYTTDELDLTAGVGLNYNGELRAGLCFTPDVIGKAVGGQLTKIRFGLALSIGSTNLRIQTVDVSTGYIIPGETLVEQTVANTVAGWNDVTLNNPITLEEGVYYLVSFSYMQTNTNTEADFPLLHDGSFNTNSSDYGFLAYGDLNGFGTPSWFFITGGGNLCIQGVVKGGSYAEKDITLSGVVLDKAFYKNGDAVAVGWYIASTGITVPTSYTLGLAIDGNEMATVNTPVTLTPQSQAVTGNVTISGLTSGSHTLSVYVKDIDGSVPTENVEDDNVETTLQVYSETLPRQKHLIEQFTSTSCGYCPNGYDMLNALTSMRDDIAWVAVHGNMNPNYPDEYVIASNDTLLAFEISGYPSASFNRSFINDASINGYGTLGVVISYGASAQQVASMFNEVMNTYTNVPSFASIELATTYDPATRKANIKVSGKGVEDFKALMGDDAVISVYLTEDGLTSSQLDYNQGPMGGWVNNYPHNHVLRATVPGVCGVPINWNGNAYENDFSVTIDDAWNAENMSVVAFISRPIKVEDGYIMTSPTDAFVTNAEVVKLGETSTGISTPAVSEENAVEVARYALDGTQLSAPAKGINIIKMSDGTTKKVIVK